MLNALAARPHKRRIVHLDQLRSVGLIVNNPSAEEEVVMEQFNRLMTSRGVMMRKIVLPQLTEDLLDKYGFPKSEHTLLFTSYNYDMLIDATPTDDVFGLYVTLSTNSSLRVGYHDTTMPLNRISENAYDLIIRGEGPMVMHQYINNLLSYLTQIRK